MDEPKLCVEFSQNSSLEVVSYQHEKLEPGKSCNILQKTEEQTPGTH